MDWRKDLPISVGSRVETTIGAARLGTVVGRKGVCFLIVWDEWFGKDPSEASPEVIRLADSLLDQLASMTLVD